jgi:hypothetical protein
LVEDGFSVADPNQGGDMVVRVRRTSEQNLNILVETSTGIRSRKVRFGEGAGEEAEFQLIQAALDLARAARDELSTVAPSLPPSVVRTRATGARVGGAMMWSGSSTGVMANGEGEARLGPLRLTLGLVAHQPLGLPSELHMFEWGALAGARLGTRALAPWLVLEAGLGVGFLQERYQLQRRQRRPGQRRLERSTGQRQPGRCGGARSLGCVSASTLAPGGPCTPARTTPPTERFGKARSSGPSSACAWNTFPDQEKGVRLMQQPNAGP